MRHLLLVLSSLILCAQAHSVTIEFPEEELAKESVLPVFDGGTTAVKSRRVVQDEKFEVGAMVGFIFNEPFFDPMTYGIHAGYHFNNFHSLHINAFLRNESLSSDAEQVDKDLGSQPGAQIINFSVVPVPKYLATVDYQLTPYYGKISLSKETTMNLALYVFGGAGMIDVGGEMTWIANVGVGQNLFITKNFGLRMDLKFLMYEGPNVTSRPDITDPTTGPRPTATVDPSVFDQQFNFSPSVMIGAVFLL